MMKMMIIIYFLLLLFCRKQCTHVSQHCLQNIAEVRSHFMNEQSN